MNNCSRDTPSPPHRRVFGLDVLRAAALLAVILLRSGSNGNSRD